MLPYGPDSNVTNLLANLLTKPSVFCYFANCILQSCFNKIIIISIIIIIIVIIILSCNLCLSFQHSLCNEHNPGIDMETNYSVS